MADNLMNKKGNGNCSFEVLLSPARSNTPRLGLTESPRQSPLVKLDDIEEKLKAAETRRQAVEASRIQKAKDDELKVLSAAQRRDEKLKKSREEIEEKMAAKMRSHQEKHDAIMKEKLEKLSEADKQIEEVQKRAAAEIEGKTGGTKEAQKLVAAQERRGEMLASIVEKQQEYEKHREEVRNKAKENLTPTSSIDIDNN